MTFSDFNLVFAWWLIFLIIGLIFLPTTFLVFENFRDKGYLFSKTLGLILLSYFVWLGASFHLLPFKNTSIFLFTMILIFLNLLILKQRFRLLKKDFIHSFPLIFFEEGLFFLTLLFWSYIRAFQPDIEGLEKFMDFGFVNSILRSEFLPPSDMWMAGETINYYYYGHYVTALLTKLSGLSSSITYNLMLATLFAFSFTQTFSLGFNLFATSILKLNRRLIQGVIAGLMTAAILVLGGNLHALWWFITHRNFNAYWYPDATRFIVEQFGASDNTIHEFPIYSFVVSDLHGHVLDIPFVLLFLAIIFAFFISNKFEIFSFRFSILLSLVLAIMYMTNSWDYPIYFLLLSIMVFALVFQKKQLGMSLVRIFFFLFFIFFLTLIFALPFNLNFSQIAQGIGLVHARSPFWQLLVLWGFPWFFGLGFLIFKKDQKTDLFVLLLFALATILVIIPEFIYIKDIYIPSYHRANTVFKLTYQSFMLYALASGYIIVRLLSNIRRQQSKIFNFYFPFLILAFLFLYFVLIYPYFAITSYYNQLSNYQGLEGTGFLKNRSSDEYQAVLWLKQNIKGQPVVLEAVGDSYTDYNRVSALTGLPTVHGWLVHEWLWRGGFEKPGLRDADVREIFETDDLEKTKTLLLKYNVSYLFFGEKEREKYQIKGEKFDRLGRIVFTSGNIKIYQFELSDS